MTEEMLDEKQLLQEGEYEYPYHYIPTWGSGGFSQTRFWSWGFRYLGGFQVVLDILREIQFDSIVDVGCGDGRFLSEAQIYFSGKTLLGIDYSERAVKLARVMEPNVEYQTVNILDRPLGHQFDVATCIEVLEHIQPGYVEKFCESLASVIKSGGKLVLTVPHSNTAVNAKHYQHFNSKQLTDLFEPYFTDITFTPFDQKSRLAVPILQRILGGAGSHFVVTNQKLTSMFFEIYRKRYLYARSEEDCYRIACVATRV